MGKALSKRIFLDSNFYPYLLVILLWVFLYLPAGSQSIYNEKMGKNKVVKQPIDKKGKVKDDYKRPPSVSNSGKVKKDYKRPPSENIYKNDFSLKKLWHKIFNNAPRESGYQGNKAANQAKIPEKSASSQFKGSFKLPKIPGNEAENNYTGTRPSVEAQKPEQSKGTTFKGKVSKVVPASNADEAGYTGREARPARKKSSSGTEFAGNVQLKRYKKGLHPSAAYWNARRKNSDKEKKWYRKFRKWWSGLWKNKDQPEHYEEENRKPRYDKEERKIWNE